jgi:dTDP-glucose 4,6-dehydratase
MRQIIFGGEGFVGRHLAPKLIADGEEVVVVDIVKSDLPHYSKARFVQCDVTDAAQVQAVGIKADDMVYNLSAKMLSPIQVRAKRQRFLLSGELSRHREHHSRDGARPMRASSCTIRRT